jgi:hypothetical protein
MYFFFSISLTLTAADPNSEIDILISPFISVRRNPEANSGQSASEEKPLRGRVRSNFAPLKTGN